MAKIGISNIRYGILTEASDGTATYGGAKTPGKAVSCSIEPETYDAELYADDALSESVKGFKNANVTLKLDEADKQTEADLLGHEVGENDEIVYKSSDTAPYVGIGRVVKKMVRGAFKYRAVFIYKIKFNEPSTEENTQGDDIEFGTTELSGTAYALANERWQVAKEFDTKSEAIEYIEKILGTTAA